MKYIRNFNTEEDYIRAKDLIGHFEEGGLVYPSVSYVLELNAVFYDDLPVFSNDFNCDFYDNRDTYTDLIF